MVHLAAWLSMHGMGHGHWDGWRQQVQHAIAEYSNVLHHSHSLSFLTLSCLHHLPLPQISQAAVQPRELMHGCYPPKSLGSIRFSLFRSWVDVLPRTARTCCFAVLQLTLHSKLEFWHKHIPEGGVHLYTAVQSAQRLPVVVNRTGRPYPI